MGDHGNVCVIGSVEEWEKKVAEGQETGKAVIVDFTAVWCGPCRFIAPVFAELSKKYPELIFLKVDVDEVQEVSEKCKVAAMPTFQVFKNGEKVDELVGASVERLEALVSKYAE